MVIESSNFSIDLSSHFTYAKGQPEHLNDGQQL